MQNNYIVFNIYLFIVCCSHGLHDAFCNVNFKQSLLSIVVQF